MDLFDFEVAEWWVWFMVAGGGSGVVGLDMSLVWVCWVWGLEMGLVWVCWVGGLLGLSFLI